MEYLRKPLFAVAIGLAVLIVLLEVGSLGILHGVQTFSVCSMIPSGSDPDILNNCGDAADLSNQDKPPGHAIPDMALLDGELLFTVALMGISILIGERLHARLQGAATLIFSILVILGGILTLITAVALLILMVSMFLAAPFGTLVYLAIFGSFPRAGAAAALSLIMTLKLGFVISLVLAQQRFLQNRGLVLLIITSFLASIIISFLQGLVPFFLVSITDDIAAIVGGVLALVWAVVFLIESLISIIKALRVVRA